MRTLFIIGTLVLASIVSLTSANAYRYSQSLQRVCKAQCNIIDTTGFAQQLTRSAQLCVDKCVAAKKAAQH